jgi:hypothetical protein
MHGWFADRLGFDASLTMQVFTKEEENPVTIRPSKEFVPLQRLNGPLC